MAGGEAGPRYQRIRSERPLRGRFAVRPPEDSVGSLERPAPTNGQSAALLAFVAENHRKKKSVRAHRGDKGECWSLPYMALGAAGVDKPCNSCGDEALYVWGRRVDSQSLAPGDIIQVEGAAEFTSRDTSRTLHFPHDHHSMIVVEVDADVIKVGHQWQGITVRYDTIRLSSKSGPGVVHCYRPQSTRK